MTPDNEGNLKYASEQLKKFFPAILLNTEEFKQKITDKTIISDSRDILPYLQSALFDEKIVEMHLDNSQEVYLATLRDFPPSDEPQKADSEEDDGEDEGERAYRFGDYLKSCQNIVSLPVEPGIGNINLRRSSRVTLRLYTTSKTVELGACFDSLVDVGGVPLLSLSFPTIGRVYEEDREFRARVPKTFKLRLQVPATRKRAKFEAVVKDISPSGLGFIVPRELVKTFVLGDKVRGVLSLNEGGKRSQLNVLGDVRHITRMRVEGGREYTCGLFLYVNTTTDSSQIEKLVAQAQRAHMREIMTKSDAFGVQLMI